MAPTLPILEIEEGGMDEEDAWQMRDKELGLHLGLSIKVMWVLGILHSHFIEFLNTER